MPSRIPTIFSSEATHEFGTEAMTDAEWARQIRSDDYEAYERLFKTYYKELVRFAEGFVRKQDVAEGLVQDVFANIWRGRRDWNPRGTLKAYLYGAARNHSLRYLRDQRTATRIKEELRYLITSSAEPADARVSYEDFSRAVRRAIENLPDRRRQVFQLSRNQGLTYAEIAAVLNISVNTVENHMVRAMKTLRAQLAVFLSAAATLFVPILHIFM